MKISLLWRLLAAFVGVVLVAVIVVAVFGAQSTAREFGMFVAHSGQMQRRPLTMLLAQYYVQNGTWDGAQELVTENADWLGGHIIVVDTQNIVVADSKGAALGQTFSGSANEVYDLQPRGEFVGRVYVNPSPDAVQLGTDFLMASTRGLAVAALAAGLVAVGFSFLVARRIMVPVRALTSAAEKMAHGDLNQRVQVVGSD
ncbi:MAG: HAMP domain-containing protein, partial [Anaerolineales bacterium]|nr:HAMP domain-containing protein [Anaerolineales bacterium]